MSLRLRRQQACVAVSSLVSLCYASLKFLRVKIEKAVWGLQGSLWVAQDSQVIRQLVRRAAFCILRHSKAIYTALAAAS